MNSKPLGMYGNISGRIQERSYDEDKEGTSETLSRHCKSQVYI
jgi:hypothetical protein